MHTGTCLLYTSYFYDEKAHFMLAKLNKAGFLFVFLKQS